jgi:catechol 2,3-dioxygenase-like lactoylglutathione lyase family enzyme/alkylhydroperoxidase family enzyme
MSRLPTHTLDSAPAAARPVLEALAQRSPTPGQPLSLHAQMAHAPAVLLGYMGLRKALDDHGTLDRKTRAALLLTVAAADECAYTVALNTLIAQQAGWEADQTRALRQAEVEDPKFAALLGVARQSALNRGRVDETTWQAARAAGWTEAELAEAFAFVGLTQYVDAFVNFARTELDPGIAQLAPEAPSRNGATTLTHLLIVADQDRTRAFYEQVLGARVVRERDPVILQFHNSWIVANVGGPPTDDKPEVSLAPPLDRHLASYALNVRVSDARAVYEAWRSRGAQFLSPPVDHGGEIRCYLRDPDGHLIEVGQSVPA